ncbi:MAG: TetR family transcriptional regulator [Desulfobacca sp. 4484_104]|nr:MAG: TetR family transcriptional regulator [Desulfobacca sp. 4484_104]RLA89241.1 MAG: TetR/AcrR family transcriptional regulator [Deltaproteobacteria bacterium]
MTQTVLPTFINLPLAKQEKIVAAALAEFADKGYQQASINVMVASSGIAKGSMYQYFKDKKGIFLYIFDFAISLVRRTLVQVKETTQEADFFTRLEKSLLAGVEFIRQHPRIYAIYLKILFDQHVPQRPQLLKAVRQFAAEYFQSLVRQGLERGEIRADLPGPVATFLLDALFDRFLQATCVPFFDVTLGLDQAPPEEIEHRVKELIDLLRQGLAS